MHNASLVFVLGLVVSWFNPVLAAQQRDTPPQAASGRRQFAPVPGAAPRGAPLHFPIPHRWQTSATQFIEAERLPKIDRPLTAKERRELKALFIWAARRDLGSGITGVDAKCPLLVLLHREFPATKQCINEFGRDELQQIKYVLDHNLTAEQTMAWQNKEDERRIRANTPRHIPGFRLPAKAASREFDTTKYLDTYPVKTPSERLDQSGRKRLFRFLAEAERLDIRKGFRGAVISGDCPLMALIRSNFLGARGLDSSYRPLMVKDVLAAMRRR